MDKNERKKSIIALLQTKKRYFVSLLMIVFLYKAVSLIISGGEESYDSLQEIKVWKGLCLVGLSFLMLAQIKIKKMYILIPSLLYIFVSSLVLLKTGYKTNSPDLWNWFFNRNLCTAISIALPTNALFEKRFSKLKQETYLYFMILMILFMFLPQFLSHKDCYFFLTVLCVMLAGLGYREINQFLISLSTSFVLAAVIFSIKSLIQNPYKGELRYYGSFTNLHGFGMFIGGSVVCCIFLILSIVWTQDMNKILRIIFIVLGTIALIFLFYMTLIINSRNSILGILVSIAFLSFIVSIRKKKIGLFIGCLLTIIFLLCLIILLMFILAPSANSIDNPFLKYLAIKGTVILASSKNQNNDGKVLFRIINSFTNQRLLIWREVISKLKIMSGNSSEIVVGKWNTNAHNTYLGYLNMYGIIPGSLLLFVIISNFAFYIIRYFNFCRDKGCAPQKINICMFGILWIAYCFSIFMFEMIYMNRIYIIICFILSAFGIYRLGEDE